MKKIITTSIIVILIYLGSTAELSAKNRIQESPDNYLTFSCFINPACLGYKHHIGRNFYVSGDLDYINSEADLQLRTGALYYIPINVLIFRFYGGSGIQFSRNQGYQYPYMCVGTNFLFLYTEMIYPLKEYMPTEYRLGFSFKF